MKVKKEYIILAAVILALSLYLFLRKTDKTHYELPKLSAVPKEDISKIEITKKGTDIILNRRNGNWNIGPQGYPADTAKVKNMLGIIENLTLTAMVSESRDYSRYQLDDEHKITVKAYIGEKLTREFDVGKAAPSYRHTFVRLKENEFVYHARENFRNAFDLSVDDLRDKQVLAFDKEEIQEIRLIKNGQSLVCSRSAASATADQEPTVESLPSEEELIWQSAEGERCDEKKLNRMLAVLSKLRCERYIENMKKEDLIDPLYRIELTGAQDYHLSIFAKSDDDEKGYPAISSENEYPFLLPEGRANSIMKALKEMLERPENKEKQDKKSE
ncbi:MAG: DUF4340 domain-containing protein [Deltaproteobacteria bacterium]|nr:DUF4340 domain-containing protein [Deltaproteobacteria bacterium]